MKHLKLLLVPALLMLGMTVKAASELYTVWVENTSTLSFYYDDKRDARSGTKIELIQPGTYYWGTYYEKVRFIFFNPTMQNYKPTSLKGFFQNYDMTYWLKNVESIQNFNYLDATNVTDMSYMFQGMESLKSVDMSVLSAATNITTMRSMFANCAKLTSLDLSGLNTSITNDMGSMFNGCSSLTSVTLADDFGNSAGYMNEMFYGCTSLKSIDLSKSNPKYCQTFYDMFAGCVALESVKFGSKFSSYAYVNTYEGMFENCSSLKTIDLRSLEIENGAKVNFMFSGCTALTTVYCDENLAKKSISATNMFYECTSLKGKKGTKYNSAKANKEYARPDFGSKNPGYFTSDVTPAKEAYTAWDESQSTLTYYFDGYRDYKDGLITEGYDPSSSVERFDGYNTKVKTVVLDESMKDYDKTSFKRLFSGGANHPLSALTKITDIEIHLVTDNIEDMSYMFCGCKSLASLNVVFFNTEKVTDMTRMFEDCEKLTSVDVNRFHTDKLTLMDYMFNHCKALKNVDMSTFTTDHVTRMIGVFNGCENLTSVNLSNINTENVTSFSSMFYDCKSLTELDLNSFKAGTGLTNVTDMFYGCVELKTIYWAENLSDKTGLTSSTMFYNCTKLEGSEGTKYESSKADKSYARPDGGTSKPGYFTKPKEVYTLWDGTSTLTYYYDNQRESRSGKTEVYDPSSGENRFNGYNGAVKTVVLDESMKDFKPTSLSYMFSGKAYSLYSLEQINGMEYLNTATAKDMFSMFEGCESLKSIDLSHFNTEWVTDLAYMFNECANLKSLDLNSFDTWAVKDMSYMFAGCVNLTSITYKKDKFSTANVVDMSYMFSGCKALPYIELSKFNTGKVALFMRMFEDCESLTKLDLMSFKTTAISSASNMFKGCSELTTIIWNVDLSETSFISTNMFRDCVKLKGSQGTTFDAGYTDKAYARPDGGTSKPGYFWDKDPEAEREEITSCTLTGYDQSYFKLGNEWTDKEAEFYLKGINVPAGVVYFVDQGELFKYDEEKKTYEKYYGTIEADVKYAYAVRVMIYGDDAKKYCFAGSAEDITATMDGEKWQIRDLYTDEEKSYIWMSGPDFSFKGSDPEPPEPTYYTLTVEISPANGGTVMFNGTEIESMKKKVQEGQSIKLTAEANSGYVFSRYEDGANDIYEPEYTVKMTKNKTVVAVFKRTEGFDEVGQEPIANSQKLLINGRIFILRGEKVYTVDGRLVR
jgi:surface protein